MPCGIWLAQRVRAPTRDPRSRRADARANPKPARPGATALDRTRGRARKRARPDIFPFVRGFKKDGSQRTQRVATLRARARAEPPFPRLARRLNAFLSAVNVGDYVVHGQLEAYSCASLSPRRSSDASTPGKTQDAAV